ncbi:MAG TPA: hypothetical protein VFZ75_06100 [Actinomycetota bacterium]|nr:hypothetical protein [Actinomycetota bacterium]
MGTRRARRWFVVALAPILVAAADPRDDVTGCAGAGAGVAPDLVEARGEIVELGTSARWKLTFAEPLVVPDAAGHPFRVDIAIHDPGVRGFTFGYYRNVNRLVRVDATVHHRTEILLLPERAQNVFNPPIVAGRSMTIQVPGRTLSDDEDLTGTSPGLEELRWTVMVRNERTCDFLGDGRPTEPLVVGAESPPPAAPLETGGAGRWVWGGAAVAGALGMLAVAGYVVRRAR